MQYILLLLIITSLAVNNVTIKLLNVFQCNKIIAFKWRGFYDKSIKHQGAYNK